MAEQTDTERGEGVAYLLRKRGGPTVDHGQAARGRFRWAGQYWRRDDATWGAIREDSYFTPEQKLQRERLAGMIGGEWVAVFVGVEP